MGNALLTGVSGLVAHQRMLEVVGNNLANLNTTGFKSQRAQFADLLYTTLRPATSANTGEFGGINPIQIGSGVKIAQVDRNFSQGNLEPTGALLDFAMSGDGFFVVNDGARNLFTRAGAFVLDESGTLVDPTNGYRVMRFGTLGEPDGINPGFQTPGNPGINIPFGTSIPGEGTTAVELSGNLSADASGPKAEMLTSSTPFTASGSAVTAGTLVNDLDSNIVSYLAGDSIVISGTDVDGTPVSSSLVVDPLTTTMGDLVAAIGAAYSDATASLDASGNLVLTADNTGEAFLTMTLADDPGNTGGTSFANHAPVFTTQGQEGDVVNGGIEVFDVRGGSHTINLTFQKAGNNVWDMTASINSDEGVMIDNSVQQIQFSDDGSLQQVLGTGAGDSSISFMINGISAPQELQLSFGSSDSFDGLTHLAADSSMAAKQNGFAPGSLVSVNVSSDGVIEGVATNGRTFPIAQLAIASFRNSKGLTSRGDNFFVESLNSGEVQLGTALSGNRGSVNGGRLESSNVDIAFEFTRLIVAQRGFSANARTITVTDEVLEELTNLIR